MIGSGTMERDDPNDLNRRLERHLNDKSSVTSPRMSIYEDLVTAFQRGIPDDVAEGVACNLIGLIEHLRVDISASDVTLCQAAIRATGACLHFCKFAERLERSTAIDIVKMLCEVVVTTNNKTTCTDALWCLAQQNLPAEIVESSVKGIMTAIDHVLTCGDFRSQTVEYEAINAVHRLLVQAPVVMGGMAVQWGKLVYRYVLSSAPKVCERALAVFELGLSHLMIVRDETLKSFVPDLRKILLREMLNELSRRPHFVLRVWSCFIDLLGPALHKGSIINNMLKVVEQCFKSSSVDICVSAFHSWKHLISAFTLSEEILVSPKRMKLCLTPLVGNLSRCRCDETDEARVETWWHLIECLGGRLHEFFTQVCCPLLSFCFSTSSSVADHPHSDTTTPHSQSILTTPTSHQRPPKSHNDSPSLLQLNVSSVSTPKQDTPPSRLLISLGVKVFELLLTRETKYEVHNTKLRALAHAAITSAEEFIPHSRLFFFVVTNLLQYDRSLEVRLLWTHLVAMVTLVLKNESVQRKDTRDILCVCLDACCSVVSSRLETCDKLEMMFLLTDLPAQILISTIVGINDNFGQSLSAADLLYKLILSEEMVKNAGKKEIERIVEFASKMTECCFEGVSPLVHIRFMCDVLSRSAGCLDSEQLFQLWLFMATPFTAYIIRTNDINDGTSLQPDFTTCYNVLLFAFQYFIDINQQKKRLLVKVWTRLYTALTNAAAFQTNFSANQCVEDVSVCLLKIFRENDRFGNSWLVCVLAECLKVVVGCVDYVMLAKNPTKSLGEKLLVSPSKWTLEDETRKSKSSKSDDTGGVMSFVRLLTVIMNELETSERKSLCLPRSKRVNLNDVILSVLVDTISHLFTHLTGSSIVCEVLSELVRPVAQLVKKSFADKQMVLKVSTLCAHVMTCVQRGHGTPYDVALLNVLSPYLEVTLCHTRKQIRNQTVIFWNATFGKADHLEYPDRLRSTLASLKQKMPIVLPGWTDDIQTNELQSQTVTPDDLSQVVVSNDIMSIASPAKLRGSFLHKACNTERILTLMSPLKDAVRRSARRKETARRKLELFDEEESKREEFVVVAPPPKKQRLLTEHQKDVLREQRASSLPAMYSLAEHSQDADATQLSDGTQSDQPTLAYSVSERQPRCTNCISQHDDDELQTDVVDDMISCENVGVVNGNDHVIIIPDSQAETTTNDDMERDVIETLDDNIDKQEAHELNACVDSHRCLPVDNPSEQKMDAESALMISVATEPEAENTMNNGEDRLLSSVKTAESHCSSTSKCRSPGLSRSRVSRSRQTVRYSSPSRALRFKSLKWISSSNTSPSVRVISCTSNSKSPSPVSPINGSPTGILKKQTNADACDSPSPSKVRHVSFAFPLEEQREMPLSSKVAALKQARKPINRSLDPSLQQAVDTTNGPNEFPLESINQSPLVEKPEKVLCLDASTASVFPSLIDNQVDISLVLPSLVSSANSHGLSQLFRARGIRTIGDLSGLTECQLQTLPIRPPKVITVRRALETFEKRQLASRTKLSTLNSSLDTSDIADTSCNEDGFLAADLDASTFNSKFDKDLAQQRHNDVAIQATFECHVTNSSSQTETETCSLSVQAVVETEHAHMQTEITSVVDASAQASVCQSSASSQTEWSVCHIPGILHEISDLVEQNAALLAALSDEEIVRSHLSVLNLMTHFSRRFETTLTNRGL